MTRQSPRKVGGSFNIQRMKRRYAAEAYLR
jgi:hypothetical protein